MNKDKKYIAEDYTSYIAGGMVKRHSNIFFERLVRILFRKTAFDAESLETLKKYQGRGKIVFASAQSTTASLLIFTSLLRRNGLPVPVLALGFRQYMLQKLFTALRQLFFKALSLLRIRSFVRVSDGEYIEQVLNAGKSVALSVLSRTLFLRRYVEIKKDFIYELVALQQKSEEPILLFPQMMFWNLNPERTAANVSARATGDRGLISGFLTTRRSVTPAFIRISEPVNLKEEIAQSDDESAAAISEYVRGRLHEVFNKEKRVVLGPVIRTRHEMMERVLLHPNVLNEIQEQMKTKRISERRLRRRAFSYFDEIAADFSINYVSFLHSAASLIFKKIFSGISFDLEDFIILRRALKKAPLIFVPAHKSHMDYLIISSMCYRNKIIPPHIVAGANLRFFPMGKLFRKSGAFFMRRSFRGLELYTVIFKQYIKTLISEGYPIEFFIEGGRTRTGKLLSPKLGILKYLVEAVDEGYRDDIMFVPVAVNYERVLEETSYSGELKGKEKKKESTLSFVKSRSLLKRNYGRVHMSMNRPISLAEIRSRISNDENEMQSIALFIARRINEVVEVTPFSLVTTGLLYASLNGFSRSVLSDRVNKLYDYLRFQNVPMTDAVSEADSLESVIDYVIEAYRQDSIIGLVELAGVKTASRESLEDVYMLNEEERIRISFYRNTIIHYIVPISFFSLSVLCGLENGAVDIQNIRAAFDGLTELFSGEFIYPDLMYYKDETVDSLIYYTENRGWLVKDGSSVTVKPEGLDELHFYAGLVGDYIESYRIVFEEALKLDGEKYSRKDFLSNIRRQGVKLFNENKIKLVESLSLQNYNNAVDFLIKEGCIAADSEKNGVLRMANRAAAEAFYGRVIGYLEKLENV